MILEGNQRGGATNLALHLMKDENEHVTVHEMRGFVSDDLVSAFRESYAISRATKCRQHLFSLSLNPPPDKNVPIEVFEDVVARVEHKLGLTDQPRAIVFHEKEGRGRHAHAVWSRIDTAHMKAVHLSHSKRKLMDISREIFIEQKWDMPKGLIDAAERDPLNYTLAQWQQAKRANKNPKQINAAFQQCWAASDSQAAFAAALKDRGYILARGDRRGFVGVDHLGEVYAVSKWAKIKAKEVREKLTEPEKLPSVAEARGRYAQGMAEHLNTLKQEQDEVIQQRLQKLADEREAMAEAHRQKRAGLQREQAERQKQETKARQARFNTGIRGLFDRLTGKRNKIERQNEREAELAALRDRKERDELVFKQQVPRRGLQKRMERLKSFKRSSAENLVRDIEQFQDIQHDLRETFDKHRVSLKWQRDGLKLEM